MFTFFPRAMATFGSYCIFHYIFSSSIITIHPSYDTCTFIFFRVFFPVFLSISNSFRLTLLILKLVPLYDALGIVFLREGKKQGNERGKNSSDIRFFQ